MIEKDWITAAGLRAVAVYYERMGHRCGYVELPDDHPLHGVDYSTESAALGTLANMEGEPIGKRSPIALLCNAGKDEQSLVSPDLYFDVHGGITYASAHCPELGDDQPDRWWYGFDCAHSGDATALSSVPGSVERSLEYVADECESLARQLANVGATT